MSKAANGGGDDADDGHGEVSKRRMVGLTLGSLGIVYGDIGTSPIYAIREALGHEIGRAHV